MLCLQFKPVQTLAVRADMRVQQGHRHRCPMCYTLDCFYLVVAYPTCSAIYSARETHRTHLRLYCKHLIPSSNYDFVYFIKYSRSRLIIVVVGGGILLQSMRLRIDKL